MSLSEAVPAAAGSTTHLVLIPSYDTGPKLVETIRAARARWAPVWVVIDGSRDGSGEAALALAARDPGLRVILRPRNGGKGAAVHDGIAAASAAGFTHALALDADGQHPADRIPDFMAASRARPEALVQGRPVFDASVPAIRRQGRRISNALAAIETLDPAIGDALFGFRVYPIPSLLAVMAESRRMRGFDFDPEALVRLVWQGVPRVELPAPVRYFTPAEGGVSHFRYLADNRRLAWMNLRLLAGLVRRLPRLLARRRRPLSPPRRRG